MVALRKEGIPCLSSKLDVGKGRSFEWPLAAAAEAGSIPVKVDVAEIIGSEANVHTVAGPHMVTIRANAHESLKPGQILHPRFPEDALHLFDGETEKALF